MREFPLAWSYLKGRPIRSIMTIISIVIGVMIMFGLNGMTSSLKDLFISNTESAGLTNIDLYINRNDGGFFREEYRDNVAAVQGVENAAPMVIRAMTVPPEEYQTPDGNDITTIQVYGIDTGNLDEDFNVITAGGRRILEGRTLEAGDTGQVVVLSALFAEGVGLTVGEIIELPGSSGWMPFEIVGILDDPGLLIGSQQVFVPLPAAQELINTPGRINIILGSYVEGADSRALDVQIQEMFGRGYELAPLEGGADVWAALLEFADLIYTLFGLFALGLAGLIMFNTFRTSVVERKRDIGMLRAVGARRAMVMRTILYEGLILAVVGTVLGLVLGFGFAHLATAGLSSLFESLLGSGIGAPEFTVYAFAVSIIFGMGVPVVSVLMPARGASQITPLEAMRPTSADEEKSVQRIRLIIGTAATVLGAAGLISGFFPAMSLGVMLFMLGLGLLGPMLIIPFTNFFNRALVLVFGQEGDLAAGNVTRQPRRASITATSLMISLAILIGFGGMLGSIYGGALNFLETSLRSDYIVMPGLIVTNDTLGAGPDLANSIQRMPGVADQTTLRQLDTTNEEGIGIRYLGIDPIPYSEIGGLSFLEGNESAFAEMVDGSTVIINGRYASQFGVEVGDTITLESDQGPVDVQVAAIGLDYLNMKLPTVYIDQTSLTREFGVRNDMFVLVNAEPGADISELEENLLDVASVYPGFGVLSREQLYESQQNVANGGTIAMNVMLMLLAAPAMLGLANALGINVIERTREIGMLRAVGARRKQIRRMIIAESLLLSLMGIALGVISGLFVSVVMTGVLDVAGLTIPYSFPAAGVLAAIAAGLIVGIVAALIPARRASDLEIVAALAYE